MSASKIYGGCATTPKNGERGKCPRFLILLALM